MDTTILKGHNPEWTRSRLDTIPNGHDPEWTGWHNPEWTPSQMVTIPNGHDPEWTRSRMDRIPNGHNPECALTCKYSHLKSCIRMLGKYFFAKTLLVTN